MLARRPILMSLALATTLAAAGCASGGDAGFCGPLHDANETAAVAFTPLIPGADDAETARTRLSLVEKLEPTSELADDLEVWIGYLNSAAETIDDDPAALLAEYDREVAAAGSALDGYYKGTCLQ
ncbi:hypothetical protein [Microbacterium sp. LWO13-1.2]|uniref:hypothetical protein n=1 Tax=Microbacterium sp. LWO13-1.2 TaxID=3135262 RepID=UPI00313934E3